MSRLTKRVKSNVPTIVLKMLGIEDVPTESVEIIKTDSEPCDSVCEQYEYECSECPINEAFEKLAHYEDLEEQGKVGDTVYVITTCKDFGKVLDGGYGTATGYYCPYDLNDSCPFEDDFEECEGGCECFENTSAIFEDYIESIMIYENETVVFLGNCGSASFSDFGKTVFLTKEEAEAKLAEMGGAE